MSRYLACLGWFWPRAAGVVLSFSLSAACAVGPDFKPPQAPPVSGYTPETHPATTTAANVAGGAAQKFVVGRDIPAEWWKVFHSKEIDALIAEALRANPNLQAAQAALWQAKENLYASAGKLLPSVDAAGSAARQQFSPAEFGLTGPPSIFNLYQATVNVAYTPDVFGGQRRQIEANAALAEYQRFELEATYPDADRERGDGGDPGSLAARPDRGDPGNHQGGNRPARSRAQSVRSRRRQPSRRADPGIGGGGDTGDVAAAAEATGAAAPCAAGVDRPLSQPGARRVTCNSRRCGCRRRCR